LILIINQSLQPGCLSKTIIMISLIKLKYLITIFIVFSPIFVTFSDGAFYFNRAIWDNDFSQTLPISFIFVSAYILWSSIKLSRAFFNGGKSFSGSEYILFIALAILSLFLTLIYGLNKQVVLTFYSFAVYLFFHSYFYKINPSEKYEIIKIANFIYFGFSIAVLTLPQLIDQNHLAGDLIPGYLHIYNYLQYFSITGVLLLFVTQSSKLWWLFWGILVWLCIDTVNLTALICALILFFWRISLYLNIRKIKSMPIFFGIFVLFIFMAPIWAYYYSSLGIFKIGDPSMLGLWARVINWSEVISNFHVFNLIIPLASDQWFLLHGWGMHNQILSLIVNGGAYFMVVACLLYVSLVLKINRFYWFGFFVIMVLAGSMLEVLTHPYLMIQIMFLLALLEDGGNKKIIKI
jgi:hypothetical protein